ACDRFKDLLRACPHHGFSELHQFDTFYNALNLKDQDSLNSTADVYVKANDAVMRNMQTQGQNMQNQLTNLTELITKFVNSNSASTSSSVENKPEAAKDTVHPTNNGSTEDVQPQVVQYESPILSSEPVNSPISEPVIAPVSTPKPNPKSSIPYRSRRNDERNREKATIKLRNSTRSLKI
nr:reverse transcriptase domain-containing protein [Tanacetum cinerariifolium]GFC00733.1 reverse transcriptase domain-containing protein [Tanacetum cinerariifolium]